jgi:hypothetical protein
MTKTDAPGKGTFTFTVYQDRFVILYLIVTAIYLLLGFLLFVAPLFDPNQNHDLKITFLIVPFLHSCLITLAVLGIAVRAAWAPRLYSLISRFFLPVLALSSLIAFMRFTLAGSIALTAVMLLLFLPYFLVMGYGRKYLRRDDVRKSFQAQGP